METRKRIKERNWDRRVGHMNYRREQEHHWAPLVESNTKAAKTITKGLRPIKREVERLSRHHIKHLDTEYDDEDLDDDEEE